MRYNIGAVSDFAVARYNVDCSLDTSFDPVDTVNGTVAFTENGSAVVLDSGATVKDSELDALNGGNGDYHGTSLKLVRTGTANVEDAFAFAFGGGSTISVNGSNLETGGCCRVVVVLTL